MSRSPGEAYGADTPPLGAGAAELRQALREARRDYQREFDRLTPTWKFAIGPLRFQQHIGSTTITWLYTVFNVVCLAAGILAILARGVWTSLGVALVVGSLFSFGTFVAQWWVVEMAREDRINDYLGSDVEYGTLAELRARCGELATRLKDAQRAERPPQP